MKSLRVINRDEVMAGIQKKADIEAALKHGEKIANCKCSETIAISSRACDYCRREQIKDFNFVQNSLDMVGGENE